MLPLTVWDTPWRRWLRQCAKNWKVVGSIPVGETGLILPALIWTWGRVRGNFHWGKGGRRLELTTLRPSWAWDPHPPCFIFINEPLFWYYDILLHRCIFSSNHQLYFILHHICKLYFARKLIRLTCFKFFMVATLPLNSYLIYRWDWLSIQNVQL